MRRQIEVITMVASVAGIFIIARALHLEWYTFDKFANIFALMLFLLIFITGLLHYKSRLSGKQSVLGIDFIRAWRIIHQSWALKLFLIIALINILNAILQTTLVWYYLGSKVANSTGLIGRFVNDNFLFWYLSYQLPQEIAYYSVFSLNKLFPFINLTDVFSLFLSTLVFLLLIPKIWQQLKSKTVKYLILPFGVFAFAISLFCSIFYIEWISEKTFLGISDLLRNIYVGERILSVIYAAFVFGGIAGSINRTFHRGSVNLATFIGDAIKFFLPLTGVFSIYYLTSAVIAGVIELFHLDYTQAGGFAYLPASIFLMFVPFAIVRHMTGLFSGLLIGIKHLFVHIKDIIAFIAIAVLLITTTHLITNAINSLFAMTSFNRIISVAVATSIEIFVSLLTIIAVCELYRRTSSETEDVVDA